MNNIQNSNSDVSAVNCTKPFVSCRFILSEQQLIHIEECLQDIEPAIKFLKNTDIGFTQGLITDASFKLLKEVFRTVRNQSSENGS